MNKFRIGDYISTPYGLGSVIDGTMDDVYVELDEGGEEWFPVEDCDPI